MLTALVFCIAGLAALVFGADLVARAGGALAARLGVPPIIIGGTIVALGTSTPELAVGIDSAIQGNGALAVGNVAGANLINLLLLLGLSAVLRPIPLKLRTLKLELPATATVAVALVVMAADGRLSPADSAVLASAAVIYTAAVIWRSLGESRRSRLRPEGHHETAPDSLGQTRREAARGLVKLGLGIVVVLVAADWLIDGAVGLARIWGVSDAFIGVTVVAIGTTSPELATTLMSMIRNQRDIGLGNLLGSSFFNIALVLGASGLVSGGGIALSPELVRLDLPAMAIAVLVCTLAFLTGRRMSRLEGGGLVAAYLAFLAYVIARQG